VVLAVALRWGVLIKPRWLRAIFAPRFIPHSFIWYIESEVRDFGPCLLNGIPFGPEPAITAASGCGFVIEKRKKIFDLDQ
jgi:hypothetical protein